MKGSTYHRCYCRDPKTDKPLGKACPKLKSRSHGSYSVRQELLPRQDGSRRSFSRAGYKTSKLAQADLDHIRSLLALAESDDRESQERIAELLKQVSDEKSPLPQVEEIRRRLGSGQELSGRITVEEWLDTWLAGLRLRKSGIARYETDVRFHLKPRLGHHRLDRLRVHLIAEMFADITASNEDIYEQNEQRRAAVEALRLIPWKGQENRAKRAAMKAAIEQMPPFRRITGPATRERIKATLRAALNDAIPHGLITFNPAVWVKLDAVRKPHALIWTPQRVAKWRETGEKPSPVMVWTPEQAGQFLDFLQDRGERLYPMWYLMAFRGLRRGEALGQPLSEVDLDQGLLTVTTQLVQDGWDVEESVPKTRKSFRTVTLDSLTRRVLAEWITRREAERLKWGTGWVETGCLFTQENGEWLHPGLVSDTFKRLVEASGLPPVRLHDLRHLAATLAFKAKVPLKIVSEEFGHSSQVITGEIYTSVLAEIAAEAAEATARVVPRRQAVTVAEVASSTLAHASLTQTAWHTPG
ncbi:site-specific integrase [Streptomyces sp. SID3343]|uniref:tyrosine-type recombinase/integrase n=1 Tax=Streptomyces sp. SID3343 TaxID=2690260 RepID=UPI00137014A7|nr:tyrosine-type recombinase/integrase [Streptomyces sp. SID3343]